MIVLGTHFDSNYITAKSSAKFARTADRIAKLVAHDIYQYGRGDVEVLTDSQFLARYSKGSSVMEEEDDERVNIVLIGDSHQNWATQLVLSERGSEGIPTGILLACTIAFLGHTSILRYLTRLLFMMHM